MTGRWIVRPVWSLKLGAALPGELLAEAEAAKVVAQIEGERSAQMVEHGVRIPVWSDDAKVIWSGSYRAKAGAA